MLKAREIQIKDFEIGSIYNFFYSLIVFPIFTSMKEKKSMPYIHNNNPKN